MARNIIVGAKINPEKLNLARELRKQMTPGEIALWRCLRGNQVNGSHFRRQQVIGGFIVDFYCHDAGLVVEVDGAVHETQKEYDADRSRRLMDHGLRVLRVREEDVLTDPDFVLEQIRNAITAKRN
jgi:very-short-patch-repair endonuclease